MPPKIARLAGLGALGASAGLLALLALLLLGTRPTPYAGMDGTSRAMTWITMVGVILTLIAVHVMIGRKLLDLAKGRSDPP
jgi:hypothetical protein